MCHISHVYENGASLYFTVVSAQGEDPVAHWTPAKHAANEAILAAGGTISHHHGVGLTRVLPRLERVRPIMRDDNRVRALVQGLAVSRSGRT